MVGNCHAELGGDPVLDQRSDLLFVGNANHTPNVDALQWWVDEIAPRLAEQVPQARLRWSATTRPAASPASPVRRSRSSGRVPETLPYLRGARVSVAPLRQGAGVKGKVGEALAAGLPVVTTSVGFEGMGLVSGRDVLVADDPADFADAVARLLRDDLEWNRLSVSGRSALLAGSGPEVFERRVLEGIRPARRGSAGVPRQRRLGQERSTV